MKRKSAAAAVLEILPNRDHYLDLKKGLFDGTTAADLDHAFATFAASGCHHLCVFFHGGLVSRADGLKNAGKLIGGYTQSGTYPFFFIWNSDLLTIIEELLHQHADDPAFIRAANRGVAAAASQIAEVLGLSARLKADATNRLRAAPLDLESLATWAEPYDIAWSDRRGAQLAVSPNDLTDFGNRLLRRNQRERRSTAFAKTKVIEARNILGRIFERLNSGHGHGLYTTTVEELLIAGHLDEKLGEPIWGRMKTDIDLSFAPNPQAGGAAFLQRLEAAWNRDPNLKVTLIGHSAGAIYVQRFVEAFDVQFAAQPARQVEIITLAAAVSFERVNRGLDALKRRASGLRAFGLSDKREGGYWEVFPIYDKSLLYIVCSLCEKNSEADEPLLGMQRYWSGTRPYHTPSIQAVIEFIGRERTVWAPSPKSAPSGYQSDAKRHGGFPIDGETDDSIRYALAHGL